MTWLPGRDRRAEAHPGPRGDSRVTGRSVVVVGGGIAGLSAAVELAERGVQVTLLERESQLGGRVASWQVDVSGEWTPMSRGFHAFFRQYYQLRALLRRADPTLSRLRPVADYPLMLRGGPRDSFAKVARTPPFNLVTFVLQSPSFPLSALRSVDVDAALGLLDVRFPQTFTDHDGISAAQVLDRLRFPQSARHLALEVFARSFFADPSEFSGGELVAMFHTYFVGSAEGLLFDVSADDFDTALWTPLAGHLRTLGAGIRLGTEAVSMEDTGRGVRVHTGGPEGHRGEIEADAVVLATDVRPLQGLVAASPSLGDAGWRDRIASLRTAPRFAVWRRWYDRPVAPGSPDFLGTSNYGMLDNVSMVHQFEDSARDWAERHGGSVVELHAYAIPEDATHEQVRADLAANQDLLHPELVGARVLGEEWLVRHDCPLVDTSPWQERPGVATPSERVVLAGDGIRCDYPVALMERAATTGVLAANHLLAQWGGAGTTIWTAPTRPRFPGVGGLRKLVRKLPRESTT
ncbi:FAD-dependent oxidoreductase [Aestuariimicrobium sp. p3-SID1156]|uniref:FAD-dependent oxidoreductase n=1 Tax=Aestuariimicrobium sp. p3-SID1156 TaxID=2916038 RepID=UPI00288303A0|nr:FAD-dependent oxidoreductase [Aestuariimicrobium sp. p3-SID1156]